jgi:rhodanese-related sulfurtransferase
MPRRPIQAYRAVLPLAALLAVVFLTACGPETRAPAEPAKARRSAPESAPEPKSAPFAWPVDAASRELRQVAKYEKDLASGTNLYPMAEFPGGVMPAAGIDPVGVALATTEEVEKLAKSGAWLLLDVRKDKDVNEMGMIPGSVHLEYRHEGFPYDGSTQLTKQTLEAQLEGKEGVVVFCNGEKCPRSFNACVNLVQKWGVAGAKVRWYLTGAPSWTMTPHIPPAESASKGR